MVKHTPGPWTVTVGTGLVHRDGDFSLGGVIARVQGRDLSSRNWREKQDANARLIAAAPELLAALERVIAVADRATDEFNFARAIVAKAKGEQ